MSRSREDFEKEVELFETAKGFEKLSVTFDQYHGYYHVVGDRGVLGELIKLAKNEVKNIYEYLNIKIEQQEDNQ